MKPFALAPRVVAFSLCCAITLPSGVYAEPDRSTLRIEEISETPSTHAELQAGLEENAGELAREWEQGMMRFQERFRALHKGDWWDKLVEYTMAENEPPKAPFTKKQFARLPRPLGKFLLQLLYEVSPVVRDQMSEGNFDSAARNAGEMERIVKHIRMTSGSVGPWLKVGIPEYRDALGELLDFLKEWRDRLDRLASPAGLEETAHPLYWSTPRFVLDGHRRSVSSLVFTPDGKSLVSGGWDGDVVIHWDTATGRSRFTAEGFYGQLGVVALSPDGKTVAFADDLAQRIRLWNTETDRELPLPVGFILRYYTGRIVALTFSPDGVHLASVDDKGTIRLWNLVSGTLQFTLKNDKKWGSLTLAFSPDGKHLVSAVGLGPIQFLDPVTGQVIGALNHPKINRICLAR